MNRDQIAILRKQLEGLVPDERSSGHWQLGFYEGRDAAAKLLLDLAERGLEAEANMRSFPNLEAVEVARLKEQLAGKERECEAFLKHLKDFASNAYVKGCQLAQRDECCGADAKMERGTFGRKELDAHKECESQFGAHFGIHAAISQAIAPAAEGGGSK